MADLGFVCHKGGTDTRVRGFEVAGPKNTFWPVFKEQLCCRTFLFYSTKAHSWCQEVTEDKTRLLQLFDKYRNLLPSCNALSRRRRRRRLTFLSVCSG